MENGMKYFAYKKVLSRHRHKFSLSPVFEGSGHITWQDTSPTMITCQSRISFNTLKHQTEALPYWNLKDTICLLPVLPLNQREKKNLSRATKDWVLSVNSIVFRKIYGKRQKGRIDIYLLCLHQQCVIIIWLCRHQSTFKL